MPVTVTGRLVTHRDGNHGADAVGPVGDGRGDVVYVRRGGRGLSEDGQPEDGARTGPCVEVLEDRAGADVEFINVARLVVGIQNDVPSGSRLTKKLDSPAWV